MKRILAFTLCMIMLLSSIPAALAEESAVLLFSDTYNDTVTNTTPAAATVIGSGSVVIASESSVNNKDLLLRNRWAETTVFYSPEAKEAKEFVLEVKVKFDDDYSKKSILQMSDGARWITLAERNKLGYLCDSLGTTGKKLSTGKWYIVSAVVNQTHKRYDLYVDGEIVARRKQYDSEFSNLTRVGFTSYPNDDYDTTMYLNYIRLYTGDNVLEPDYFEQAAFNPQKKNVAKTKPSEPVDKPVVKYDVDFESYTQGAAVAGMDATGGKQSVMIDEKDDNHYYKLYKTDVLDSQANILVWQNGSDFYPDTVISADFRAYDTNTEKFVIMLRDNNAAGERIVSIGADGCVYLNNGKRVSENSCIDTWMNVAVATHFRTKTFDVYINGEKKAQDISFLTTSLSSDMYHVRLILGESKVSKSAMDIDNICIYSAYNYHSPDEMSGTGGQMPESQEEWTYVIDSYSISPDMSAFTKVKDTPTLRQSPRLTDYSLAKAAYKDAICFVEGTNNIWIKDAKYKAAYPTIWEEEKIMVAAPVLAALINKNAQVTDGSAVIGNITAKAGDSYITVAGEKIETEVAVKKENGTIYLPLKEFSIYGMKKWYGSSFLGFSVIANEKRDIHYQLNSNRPNLYTVGNTTEMMAYLLMDLPNTEKLLEVFNANKSSAGRRSLVAEKSDFERIIKLIQTDAVVKEYAELAIIQANALVNTQYTSSDAAGAQSAPIFSMMDAWCLYFAYKATGDTTYVKRAEELALQMANLSHWSSSFHFLQTAQALSSMAYFYDLFYEEFSKDTKDTIARAIIDKGLKPAQTYYYGSTIGVHNDWCTRNTNWNSVPNNGAMLGAMAILGDGYDDALCLDILEKSFVSLGYFMQYYAPDGSAGEGIGYTNLTLSYMCPTIDALNSVFGTDFGLSDYPGFMENGYFIPHANSYKYVYTLNDDGATSRVSPALSLWFSKHNGDASLQKLVLEYMDRYPEFKSAWANTILTNYVQEYYSNENEVPYDGLYNGTELALSRDSWGESGTFMGFHGGYNHIAHGRYDYGTFIFDAFGMRFATEPGQDAYSLPSIGDFSRNHQYYTIRTEGHNTYVVNPDSSPGQNRYTYGRVNVQEMKEKGVIYTLDMLPAYYGYVKEAKRGCMLTNDRKVFVIQDEIVPIEGNYDEFYWFWHTNADIEIDEKNNIVTLTQEYKKVRLYFDANVEIILSADNIKPLPASPTPAGQLQTAAHKNMKKITAKFFGAGEPITFRVIAEPVGQSYERGELTPISEWSIPDGSYADEYYDDADSILVDGNPLEGFDSKKLDYTVYYSALKGIPDIKVESKGQVTIIPPTDEETTAIVKVESSKVPGNFRIYTITFQSDIDFGIPEGGQRLDIKEVTVSASDGNIAANVLDGDINTRWSSANDQWIMLDLGEEMNVNSLALSTFAGNQRKLIFDIEVSSDGENFVPVKDRILTSGKTTDWEYTTFRTVKTRYVRVNCHGTSINQYNSITEMALYYITQ